MVHLLGMLLPAASLLTLIWSDDPGRSRWIILMSCILAANFYPFVLQRYTRARICKVLETRTSHR